MLTITDLGMVRNVAQMGEGWVIGFTPTYSGCPATEHLIGAIREAMTTNGFTPEVLCPRCASVHTTLISEFGSTACKALYRCDSCREPFDYFKCI